MNKVKYGLKNVHFAKATINADGTATFGSVRPMPGAVNLSLDPEGELSKFFADDSAYYSFSSNAGYAGDLEIAIVPDEFRTEILGEGIDSNGVQYEDSDAAAQPFALLFEFAGDKNRVRHVMYNCTATRPAVAGATTEESIEAQTETLSLSCGSIHNAALDKNVVKAKADDTKDAYANWFTSVYQSTGAGFAVWPSSVTAQAGDVVLAEFSGNAGTVTASSDNEDITVTVANNKVVISVDADAEEGGIVSVVNGGTTKTIAVVLA